MLAASHEVLDRLGEGVLSQLDRPHVMKLLTQKSKALMGGAIFESEPMSGNDRLRRSLVQEGVISHPYSPYVGVIFDVNGVLVEIASGLDQGLHRVSDRARDG